MPEGYSCSWQQKRTDTFTDFPPQQVLQQEVFNTLREAQVLIKLWRRLYNERRPHSALRLQAAGA
jgi:transposase InsO family protein